MLANDQWKQDMRDGIVMANLSMKINGMEGGRLSVSIDAPIDPERMKDDTIFRTKSRCPIVPEPGCAGCGFGFLASDFHDLNRGQDGG